jgi:hypothetical protein
MGRARDGYLTRVTTLLGSPSALGKATELDATDSSDVLADPPEADSNQGNGTANEDCSLTPLVNDHPKRARAIIENECTLVGRQSA